MRERALELQDRRADPPCEPRRRSAPADPLLLPGAARAPPRSRPGRLEGGERALRHAEREEETASCARAEAANLGAWCARAPRTSQVCRPGRRLPATRARSLRCDAGDRRASAPAVSPRARSRREAQSACTVQRALEWRALRRGGVACSSSSPCRRARRRRLTQNRARQSPQTAERSCRDVDRRRVSAAGVALVRPPPPSLEAAAARSRRRRSSRPRRRRRRARATRGCTPTHGRARAGERPWSSRLPPEGRRRVLQGVPGDAAVCGQPGAQAEVVVAGAARAHLQPGM